MSQTALTSWHCGLRQRNGWLYSSRLAVNLRLSKKHAASSFRPCSQIPVRIMGSNLDDSSLAVIHRGPQYAPDHGPSKPVLHSRKIALGGTRRPGTASNAAGTNEGSNLLLAPRKFGANALSATVGCGYAEQETRIYILRKLADGLTNYNNCRTGLQIDITYSYTRLSPKTPIRQISYPT